MKVPTLLASLVLSAAASFSYASGEGWLTDFEAAKKKAAEEKKDLLVDFTGSDWCHWCIKLDEEVFQKEPFKKAASDKYVFVELDFPQDKSKQSEKLQKQNEELREKFDIQGFPSILLLDSKGRPFAQTGYQEGGPEAYLKHLEELRENRIERDEKLSAANKLEGIPKAKALLDAISFLPPTQLSHYAKITQEIVKLDPNDETGYLAGQKKAAAFQSLEKSYMTAMQAEKIDEAIKIINNFITEHKLKDEELQQTLSMKMDPLLGSGNFAEAEKVIDEIIIAGPETKLGKFAENFKPQLAKMKEQASAGANDTPPGEAPAPQKEEKK